MSVSAARARELSDDVRQAAVDELVAAVDALPDATMGAVRRHLAEAMIAYEVSGDIGPVRHFVDSLFITARLHRDPDYRRAVEDAERTPLDPDNAVDVVDFIAELRERRGGRS